jgi:hypothetical protein
MRERRTTLALLMAGLMLLLAGGGSGGGASDSGSEGVSLTIWADDKYSRAIKESAAPLGGRRTTSRSTSRPCQGPPDRLRHRRPGRQGPQPGHGRLRLDRQPGPERHHRPAAADRRHQGGLQRARHPGRDLQRPGLRDPVRHRERGPVPQHRPGADRSRDHGGAGRQRQGTQGAGTVDEIMACRWGPTATPTTCTRSTPPAAGTCSARAPRATTPPRTSACPSPRPCRRSRRSARRARRARGRSSARSPPRT